MNMNIWTNIKHNNPYVVLGKVKKATNGMEGYDVVYTREGRVYSRDYDEFLNKFTPVGSSTIDEMVVPMYNLKSDEI